MEKIVYTFGKKYSICDFLSSLFPSNKKKVHLLVENSDYLKTGLVCIQFLVLFKHDLNYWNNLVLSLFDKAKIGI